MFFVILLCSVVFSQTIDDSKIDVSKLFDNAAITVDALYVHIPVFWGETENISNEILIDNESLIKY